MIEKPILGLVIIMKNPPSDLICFKQGLDDQPHKGLGGDLFLVRINASEFVALCPACKIKTVLELQGESPGADQLLERETEDLPDEE